jgi:predicted dehydrogenase
MHFTRRHFFQSAAALALAGPAAAGDQPRRIRIGQIGTQHGHAAGKMETLRRLGDHFEVAGLAGAAANAAAAFNDIPRMDLAGLLALPGLEAVVVETDFPDACAAAHAAIKAGKHVHLDKPGALDHAAFKAMRTEAEERGLIFQMGYMLRYNPAFQLLHRAVTEGWLGRITELDAMMGKKLDAPARRELLRLEGGGMFELGCHLVDAACWLLGKPAAVHAFSKPAGTDGFKDNQLALLEFPGSVATLRCSMTDPFGFPRRRFQIAGTEGSMEVMPLESGRITARLTKSREDYNAGEQLIKLPVPPGRYDAELTAFAAAIRAGRPLPWNAAHDITVHENALRAGGAAV